MRTLVVCLLVSCSHPPPPKPPPVEVPVTSFASVGGEWVTSDDLDWSYFLKIDGDDFLLAVDRGKLGKCMQHGALIKGATAPKFELEVSLDDCHRDRAAGPLYVTFPSFTGKTLTVELIDGDQHERHTFTTAPNTCRDQCNNE